MTDEQPNQEEFPRGEVDFGTIGRAMLHPMQAEILELMAGQAEQPEGKGRPLSASDLMKALGTKSLAQVSYHCLALLGRKWIKKAGSERVRGATKQFYVYAPENIKPHPGDKGKKGK